MKDERIKVFELQDISSINCTVSAKYSSNNNLITAKLRSSSKKLLQTLSNINKSKNKEEDRLCSKTYNLDPFNLNNLKKNETKRDILTNYQIMLESKSIKSNMDKRVMIDNTSSYYIDRKKLKKNRVFSNLHSNKNSNSYSAASTTIMRSKNQSLDYNIKIPSINYNEINDFKPNDFKVKVKNISVDFSQLNTLNDTLHKLDKIREYNFKRHIKHKSLVLNNKLNAINLEPNISNDMKSSSTKKLSVLEINDKFRSTNKRKSVTSVVSLDYIYNKTKKQFTNHSEIIKKVNNSNNSSKHYNLQKTTLFKQSSKAVNLDNLNDENKQTIDSLIKNGSDNNHYSSNNIQTEQQQRKRKVLQSKNKNRVISAHTSYNKSFLINNKLFQNSLKLNKEEIADIKDKVRRQFKERLQKEQEFSELNITTDNNMMNNLKANENNNNNLNKSYSLNKSMNPNLLTNSANKSIFNYNKTKALEKLLEYTNLVELEKYYFPFNKDKDLKKIHELGKIFRIGVHQINSPFFENYTNKINYIEDCRRVPYFNSNLEKFIDKNKDDKNIGYVDSLSFKDKIEKLQHPNVIRPSAFFQLNMAKINREIKLKETKLKERSLIKEKKSKKLSHYDNETKLRKMFVSQIDENLDEDMIKFFKYDKLKYLDNVLFEKGRAVETVLNII